MSSTRPLEAIVTLEMRYILFPALVGLFSQTTIKAVSPRTTPTALPICGGPIVIPDDSKDRAAYLNDCKALLTELTTQRYEHDLVWAGPAYEGDDYEYMFTPWHYDHDRCRLTVTATDGEGGALKWDDLAVSFASLITTCTEKYLVGSLLLGERQNVKFTFEAAAFPTTSSVPSAQETHHLPTTNTSITVTANAPTPICTPKRSGIPLLPVVKGNPIIDQSMRDACDQAASLLLANLSGLYTYQSNPPPGSPGVKLPRSEIVQGRCAVQLYASHPEENQSDTFRLWDYQVRMRSVWTTCFALSESWEGNVAVGEAGAVKFRIWVVR